MSQKKADCDKPVIDMDDLIGEQKPKLPPILEEMNRKHAKVIIAGKPMIITECEGGEVTYSSIADFKGMYTVKDVPGLEGEKSITKATYFLSHPLHRQYSGIAFLPGQKAPPHIYNLSKPFPVKPDPEGNCSIFLEHLRDNICSGNDLHYQFLLGFMAHSVQRPWELPGTAIVLRGIEGTGKDTVGYVMRKILGDTHYVVVEGSDQLYDKFNTQFQCALFVHLEEAIWVGERKHHSKLKSIITRQRRRIEPKGVNSFEVDNFARYLFTSNDRWVISASLTERRWFFLDVSSKRAKDTAYFAKLWKQMEEENGYEKFMHILMNFDLSTIDIRNPPETKGMLDQRLLSLPSPLAWLFDALHEGTFGDLVHEEQIDWVRDPLSAPKVDFFNAYKDWARHNRPPWEKAVGRNEFYALIEERDLVKKSRPWQGGQEGRKEFWEFPALNKGRKSFEKHLPHPYDWPEIDEDLIG